MRRLTVFMLLLVFAFSNAEAKSVSKSFMESWLARDNQYVAEAQAAAEKQTVAVNAFHAALQNGTPDLPQLTDYMLNSIEEFQYKNARGETLRNFRIHMLSKPDENQTGMWMQERLGELKLETNEFEQKNALVNKMAADKADDGKFIEALEAAYVARGHLRGIVDELTLIDQNLSLFSQAKTDEAQRRQAFWRALSRAGQAMQSAGNAIQANSPRYTSCSTVGQFTNCTTN